MIDKLLGSYLKELGLTEQEFVNAVSQSSTDNEKVSKLIFGQILAVDNFLTFKKMMIERGKHLERKALKMLKNPKKGQAKSSKHQDDAKVRAMTEEEQLSLALKLSAQLSRQSTSEQKKHVDKLEDVLKASVIEADLVRSQLEQEQAELEHAIALSLDMENERIKKIRAAEEEEKNATNAASKATAKAKKEKLLQYEAKIMAQEDAEAKGETYKPAAASAALPTIAVLEQRHTEHKKQVAEEFKQNDNTKKEKKKKVKKALEDAGIDNDELTRRQEFLRAQKELIAQKRAAERDEELKEYAVENKSNIPLPASAEISKTKPTEIQKLSPEEMKQQDMRKALALRFKTDMQVRKQRIETEKQDEYASLSAQLRKAQALRKKMDDESQAEMSAQEKARKEQLNKFHQGLAKTSIDASASGFM